MKILNVLILGLTLTAITAYSQNAAEPGRYQTSNPVVMLTPGSTITTQAQLATAVTSPSGPGYAEAITPDIQALADGLQDNPVKIFNYVHNHIRFVLYYGSMKGAELTLLEQSGNSMDQCALLVALLRAAGYSPGYGFGMQEIPYQATDGSDNDLRHWLHLTLPNTNWTTTAALTSHLLGNRGFQVIFDMGDSNDLAFQQAWVTLNIGGTNYLLDPAFKVSEQVGSQVDLASAMGYSSNGLMNAAGGDDMTNYVQYLDEASLRDTLTGYTSNLLAWLHNNDPNASVQDILGGWQIVPSTNTVLSQTLPFPTFTNNGQYPLLSWNNEPTNWMSSFSVNFAGTNQTWYFPQLEGQGVSLDFDKTGTATLWLGDTKIIQSSNTGSGSSTSVTLTAKHPFGGWNTANNVPVDTGWADETNSQDYQRTNAYYALMYSFEPSVKWLHEREQQLDEYLTEGYSNTAPEVVNQTLNVMGLQWMVQTRLSEDLLCKESDLLPACLHRIGRMAQEAGKGYYVDVYMQEEETLSAAGYSEADIQNEYKVFDVSSYIWSALEHGIIEQLQDSNLVAASTVKMLQIANTNNEAVYLADSNNWSAIQGNLVNYGPLMSTFGTMTSEGYYLLLPQNGANPVAGSGSWTGDGFVELQQTASARTMGMEIGGNYNGGYVSLPTATVNPPYVNYSSDSQPFYYNNASAFTFNPTAADPVDMANGTFQLEHTDLSLGQAEPRGISLSCYYNGNRKFSDPSGMADGWVNNYTINAATVAAPQAGLGGTTPEQMAPMLVTTYAALNLYNDAQPDPKNWMVTALISKWGVDQLIKNGVSVNLGKDTMQFVKQPNGQFTPPANCTLTLIQTNGVYWLQKRHGNTFKFDSQGRLANIVDPYNNSLSLTYNSSNWVSTVTDWKNRKLTFNYSGAPLRLTSVSDGSRTVYYGYSTTYNPQGDLTKFTDAQGDPTYYQYNTNHQITATIDALNRLVVSNNYDALGHVTTQLTEGLANKTWHIFWSGWQTIAENPAGDETTYFYDDQHRLIGTENALGDLSQNFYDGQDHVVETISPLAETNQYVYDSNNNLIEHIDPLGFTNQFFYNSQNLLYLSKDGLGNPTTYGYNAEYSLTGKTNGAGDWVSYAYNNDGTLQSRTDAGGTTKYDGYDAYGQLTHITYPNNDTESFINDEYGDVKQHTDGRNFTTTYQYNNRRELTNTIAPTNVVISVAYGPADNVSSRTDGRRLVTSYTWSATRHKLTTTLPTVAAGTPVLTRVYDNREWLSETLNPLLQPTYYTNNAAHWLIAQSDPLSRTTRFSFDADGRKTMTINPNTETNSQTWNANSELVRHTDGAGHYSLRNYDAAGNQIILTNRDQKVWQFQFDGANRRTKTIPPSPMNATSRSFNDRGLLSTITDPSGQVIHFHYDSRNRLTNRTDNTGSTFYMYDADNNQTSVRENGQTNTWTYDAYNRVSTYRDALNNLIQYRYDSDGNLTNIVYPGGKNVYYTYDNDNHLKEVKDWANRITTYSYDLAGRLTKITRPNGTYRTLDYNAAGQVTNIWEQMPNGMPIAWFRYNWNSNSTIGWEFAAPLPHNSVMPTRKMTYNADNELATFQGPTMLSPQTVQEDANGNLEYAPLTNDTFVTYSFDGRNRLLSAGGVTNVYDGANNRIGQIDGTNVTAYVVNPNAKLPQVLMRIRDGVTNYYVYGLGLLYQVTETTNGEKTLTYHYDYRGSTIALTDDSGTVKDRFEYSLYGTLTYRTGTDNTPFLFNGRYGVQSDPDGLLYMRARYYDPYLCRFINPDPSGFKGGLNFYAYANGNPVSLLDPFGLGAVGENSSSSWIMNGIQTTASQIGNSFVNSPYSPVNIINSAVYQTINGGFAALGMVGQAEGGALNFLGIDDPAALVGLPGGGAVGEEINALDEAGAIAAEGGVQTLDASAIRFSQSSVNNVGEIADSMAANGWQGSPVTVVRMADGSLTTVDNTRVLAAGLTGTPVQATIFDAGASIDASQAIRFVGPNGGLPTTWGDAVLNRIGNQNSLFRTTYPSGSPVTGLSSW